MSSTGSTRTGGGWRRQRRLTRSAIRDRRAVWPARGRAADDQFAWIPGRPLARICPARPSRPGRHPSSHMTFRFMPGARDAATRARRGILHTAHGTLETPAFMPVGTRATVTGLTPEDLHALGAGMILGNTYHLLLRPGPEAIRHFGGLHRFLGWDPPILPYSGGFHIFSLTSHS